MTNQLRRITLIFLLILLLHNSFAATTKPDSQSIPIVITHVSVIDTTGGPSKRDMTVVIAGNRIAELGKSADILIPINARVVDGTGKYLIPGLWDMHWHSLEDENTRAIYFPLAIANGVTGGRDMFGDCYKGCDGFPDIQVRNRWRKEIEEGKLIAPRIVPSSQIVDGAKPVWQEFLPVANAAEARAAVGIFKQRGADFIKVYSLLSRDAYFAIADESKKQNIPFAGHVPIYVRATEASDAGQKSIEHLDFMALSSRETELMREMADEIEKMKTQEPFILLVYRMLDRYLIKVADTYDSQKTGPLARRFARNGTWLCPTMVLHRADAFQDDSEYTADPRLKYMPEEIKKQWIETRPWRRLPPNEQEAMKRVFPIYLKIVGSMHRAGAKFMAGTDITNNYLYPGFSLHDELALFVKAGFTPLEALQTATINPAVYLSRSDSLGSIEKGKLADMVLLDADPLEDIANTRHIAAVVFNGRFLSKQDLQQMLSNVTADSK